MARVCTEWYPERNGFYMDDTLKLQIDVLLRNMGHDWDFTIVIGGEGDVRVGKSKLAMDIAAYWTYEIWKKFKRKCPFSVRENFVFEGSKLISVGNHLGRNYPYSALVFDEAGADLEGRKIMRGSTQDVLDYFRECGQYNMLNILVLPEFFDLPRGIALSRSFFFLNVYYNVEEDGLFRRGFFKFYSKRQKKWLYNKGKKDYDYNCVKADFKGRFMNFYQVDEAEYRKAKYEALIKRESKKRNKFQAQRDALLYLMCKEKQQKDIPAGETVMNQTQLGIRLEQLTGIYMPQNTISDALRKLNYELTGMGGDEE